MQELLGRGYTINALAHRRGVAGADPRITTIQGDLFDDAALSAGMGDCQAVIHLVGIIMENRSKGITFERIHFEGARHVIDAAKASGIRRFVHMSALGVRENAVSGYHQTKWRAEEYLRNSGLDYTIFRPSIIHGPAGEFMTMEANWARKKAAPFLFMPYFGAGILGTGGAGKLQPVYVGDVARAFVDALEKPSTIGKTYALAGPDQITWKQMHQISSQAIVGKKRLVVPLPVWYARLLTYITPSFLLPFNRDQVIMSQEDNTGDIAPFVADFGFTPRPFEQMLREYAAQL
jgi:NADH dehydrogenase